MSSSALLQSVIGTDALDVQKMFNVKGWVVVGELMVSCRSKLYNAI